MKIYVAGSSKERDLIRAFLGDLRNAGIQITFDWVKVIDEDDGERDERKGDDILTHEKAGEIGNQELAGVKSADLFWLISPEIQNPSRGAWVELGYALAQVTCTTVVSGEHRRKCLFTELCDYSFDFHGEAFGKIVHLAKLFDSAEAKPR